ncbi:MAG TPA: SGNH/GDSL hydrolase family protein [Terriglobales bacterium]|nr:SGNH/GDSL hydrolase family protein [Terriglobales bacterium]
MAIPTSGLKRFFFTLLTLGAGCFLALLLLEGMLRVYNPFGTRIHGSHIVLARNRKYVYRNREITKLDPVITEYRNSLGFRGPDPPKEFANDLTIVTVGGSTTHCLYLSDSKTWPTQLSNRLQTTFPNVWVDNAGLDGHSTIAHIALLEDHVIKLHPKVVTFLIGRNDMAHTDLGDFDADGLRSSVSWKTPQDFLYSMSGYSEVASLTLDTYRTITSYRLGLTHENVDLAKVKYEDPSSEEEAQYLAKHKASQPAYADRVKQLIEMCRRNHIEPVLITQPMLAGPVTDDVTHVDLARIKVSQHCRCNGEMWWDALEMYNDTTRKVARENNVILVDLAKEMPKSSRYFYDFVHFTNEGAQKVADIIDSSLCPALASKFPNQAKGTCSVPVPSFSTSNLPAGAHN